MLDNDWSSADAVMLRQLFAQHTGQKLLRRLRAKIPRVTSKQMEQATLEAVEKQGAENIYNFLVEHADEVEVNFRDAFAPVDLTKEGD